VPIYTVSSLLLEPIAKASSGYTVPRGRKLTLSRRPQSITQFLTSSESDGLRFDGFE